MTDPARGALRHRLILGKYRVSEVNRGAFGCRFTVLLGGSVSFTVDAPIASDVRQGDWLTLYTEVLANAEPEQSSIQ